MIQFNIIEFKIYCCHCVCVWFIVLFSSFFSETHIMVSKKGLIWAKERNTDKILLLISMNNIQYMIQSMTWLILLLISKQQYWMSDHAHGEWKKNFRNVCVMLCTVCVYNVFSFIPRTFQITRKMAVLISIYLARAFIWDLSQ